MKRESKTAIILLSVELRTKELFEADNVEFAMLEMTGRAEIKHVKNPRPVLKINKGQELKNLFNS